MEIRMTWTLHILSVRPHALIFQQKVAFILFGTWISNLKIQPYNIHNI